jgi:hypothetical protein
LLQGGLVLFPKLSRVYSKPLGENMLISLLFAALILFVIWYIGGRFMKGPRHQLLGIVLALVFLFYALWALHLFGLK